MSHDNIERFIVRGYELTVKRDALDDTRPYHAVIEKRRDAASHHHLGKSVGDAIEGLDEYLAQFSPPQTAEPK